MRRSTIRAIARFPDPTTSALIVGFLAVLHPITAFVWDRLHPPRNVVGDPQPPPEYPRHCLFTLDGGPMEAPALRAIFERKMLQ